MRYAFALLLLGCGTLPSGARPAPSYARAALATWTAAGYPAGRCAEQARILHVLETSAAETRDLCHEEGVAGCLLVTDVGLLGLGGDQIVVVMDRQYAGPWLLAHEATHWLGRCSGLDVQHGDSRFFQAPGSVQARLAEL